MLASSFVINLDGSLPLLDPVCGPISPPMVPSVGVQAFLVFPKYGPAYVMGDLRKTIEQPVGKLPEDVGKPQPLPLKVGFSFKKPGYFAAAVFRKCEATLCKFGRPVVGRICFHR